MKLLSKSFKTLISLGLLGCAVNASAVTEIMVAYGNQPGEPIDRAMNLWADKVREKSNGDIVFKLFPSSQLGSQTEVLEQAKFGANILTISDYGELMDIVPDFGVINAPYITQSFEKKSKLLHSDWFKDLSAKLDKSGIHIIVPDVIYGTRHLLTKKPVTKPEDLKGTKVRVQPNRLFIQTIQGMGGVPTAMSLADVYPGLSSGIVDGLENPSVVLYGGKFYEEAKNLNLTAHMKNVSPFIMGTSAWNKLTPEQQQIITETSRDMVIFIGDLMEEAEKEAIEKLKAAGVTVNEVDIKAFENSVRETIAGAFPEWTPNLYKDIQEKLAQFD